MSRKEQNTVIYAGSILCLIVAAVVEVGVTTGLVVVGLAGIAYIVGRDA